MNEDDKKKVEEVIENSNDTQDTKEDINVKSSENNENDTIDSVKKMDFVSIEEINQYLKYLSKDQRMDGFRKGRIPVQLLYMKYDGILDRVIYIYLQHKNMETFKFGYRAEIDKVEQYVDGFMFVYQFTEIKQQEKAENITSESNEKTENKEIKNNKTKKENVKGTQNKEGKQTITADSQAKKTKKK